MAQSPQLNVYSCVCSRQEQQTAFWQSLAEEGVSEFIQALNLNLGKRPGLFSLFTIGDVQIHTDRSVAETILLRYLKIHPGFENVRPHMRR